MPELLKACLIVCPLVFLAGFVDSIAGGGGIITIPAYLLAGIPIRLTLGTNKAVACCGTALSAGAYFKAGRVRLRVALLSAAGAVAGAFVGTKLALVIPERTLHIALLCVLPCVAVFLALNRNFGREDTKERDLTKTAQSALSLAIGFVLGCYDGLIGPGTGTFLILAYSGILGLDLLTASGCAKVSNLASNFTSAVIYLISGNVYYAVAGFAVIFFMSGCYFGSRYALRGGSKNVRKVMFVVLGLLFVKMIYELAAAR